MLLFVSDLHLTDRKERSSFSTDIFVRRLEEVLQAAVAEGVTKIELVLLGDILEMLKSKQWLADNVRPWEPLTTQHENTVAKIANDIFDSNADFFASLRRLRDQYPLTVSYYPGNHDLPINTEMGKGSRRKLRELLDIAPGDDRYFLPNFDDSEHGVTGVHGHHWDRSNRYLHGMCAAGDFVVIDVITRLPGVLAMHLQMDENDPSLDFAHQIDDVIPQTVNAMATWLVEGIDRLTRIHGPRALRNATGRIAEELEHRMRGKRFESKLGSWWVKILKRVIPHLVGRVELIRPVRWLTSPKLPAPKNLVEEAHEDLIKAGEKTEYILFGHTHIPEYRTIAGTPVRRYLNIGTWRRAHRRADVAHRKAGAFVTTNVGAIAIIRSSEEARATKLPRHELRQFFYV